MLCKLAHHVTRPAPAHTSAPATIVHGTPTACDSKPDSMPPTGIGIFQRLHGQAGVSLLGVDVVVLKRVTLSYELGWVLFLRGSIYGRVVC